MNIMDFDFVNDIDKVVITGGRDGCLAHVHWKNGRVDAHAFVKQNETVTQQQGVF